MDYLLGTVADNFLLSNFTSTVYILCRLFNNKPNCRFQYFVTMNATIRQQDHSPITLTTMLGAVAGNFLLSNFASILVPTLLIKF